MVTWGYNTIMQIWLYLYKTISIRVYTVMNHLNTSIPQAEALI